jgi:type I restriction enzyme S subunit
MSKECVRIIPNKFYLNDSGLSIHTKNLKLQKYVNQYLLTEFNQKYIYEYCTSGSIQRNINMAIFRNLQIPIPKSEQKIKEWVDKISKPYDEKNSKQNKIKELEEYVKNKIKDISENEDCDEVELGSVCEFKSGKFKSSDCKNIGLYPFFNGKAIQPDGYSDNFCYDSKEYIILIKDGGAGVGKYGEQIGLGNVFLVKGKSGFTSHQLALEQINTIINNKYLYYILKTNKNNIMDLANYSTSLGTINKNDLSKFKIKIPKNKQLIQDLEPTFDKIEKLLGEVKEAEMLYNKLIKELSDEAIPKL